MPETRSLVVAGDEIVFDEWTGAKAGGTGTDWLLVHGIGMGRVVFRDLAERLAAAPGNGRIVAIDQPGFGDSPDPQRARTMAETGDLLAAFVVEARLSGAIIVGHSMGTQVVAEAVRRHPQLTDKVVLIAPTANESERSARMQAWRTLQDLAGESPKVLAIGMWQYAKAGPLWFVKKLRLMLAHAIEDVLPRVPAQALVLRGETDRVCPHDWCQRVADLLPMGELREIPDRGHEAMIKNAAPAAALLLEFASRRRV